MLIEMSSQLGFFLFLPYPIHNSFTLLLLDEKHVIPFLGRNVLGNI